MGIPASLGIGSGLNLGGLLDQLAQSEQQRLVPLQTRKASYQVKLSAYGQLQDALNRLDSAAQALGKPALYQGVRITSQSEAFTSTAADGAFPGRFQIDVNQLARSQSLVSNGVASTTATIGEGGAVTLTLADSGGQVASTVTLNISQQQSTLAGIRDAINAADIGITASIINDGSSGTPYRLTLTSKNSGTDSQISVQISENPSGGGTPLGDLLAYDSQTSSGALTQTVAAANAQLTINGISIVRQGNVVEGAIQGVTLTLTGKTTTPQTLQASRDTAAIKSAIKDFVSAYNSLHSLENELTAYSGDEGNNGVLLGDSIARTVENRLRRALNTPVQGGAYFALAQIGVAIQRDGTMEIDADRLDQALATDLADMRALLSGTGTTRGMAAILTSTLEQLAGDNGVLAAAATGLENRINRVDERIGDMQVHINASIARYRAQFVQLDSIMAQLGSTQSYLSRQLDALANEPS